MNRDMPRERSDDMARVLEKGLVHVYMGDGKGKTTSALGLVLRMTGAGGKSAVVQFMKGWPYSEIETLALLPGVTVVQTGRPDYLRPETLTTADFDEATRGMDAAREFLRSGWYDLVVLDEINVALSFGLIAPKDVAAILEGKAVGTEVVLTGRNPPDEILRLADLITDMREVRHPYGKGLLARKGVDC